MAGEIDLYAGGPLGLWALEQIGPEPLANLITVDEAVAARGRALGLPTIFGNVHEAAFENGPLGLSVHYPRLIKPPLLGKYRRLYNLHAGLLPWGRGYYPVFWSIWEGTPAGCTLHEIDAGIDTGPIVAQREVPRHEHDTGGTLHARVQEAERALFLEHWPRLRAGETLPSRPQPPGGTYHTLREFRALKREAAWQTMAAPDLIRLMRALTFPGYSGLELSLGGQAFSLQLDRLDPERG
jgi:methionyl-tRNA formyltransferase